MKKIYLASLLSFLLAASAHAIESGKAAGSLQNNDRVLTGITWSGARLQSSPYGAGVTELMLVISDRPFTREDLEDDTVPHSNGLLTVKFVDNAPSSYTIDFLGTDVITGKGLKFDGTIDDQAIIGRLYSNSDEKLRVDLQVYAPIVSSVRNTTTASDRATASASDQMRVYMAFLAAIEGRGVRATISRKLTRELDGYSGMITGIRAGDVTAGGIVPLRITVTGDDALLQAETWDQKGRIRFVREDGSWKVEKETWKNR